MDAIVRNIGLLAIGYYLIKQGSGAISQRIIPGVPTIRFTNLNISGIRAKISLPITNNTPAPLPLDSFIGALWYGPHQLAQVNFTTPVMIRPGQTQVLPINAVTDFAQVGQEILDFVGSGQLLHPLYIKGNLISVRLVIPINQKIQLV